MKSLSAAFIVAAGFYGLLQAAATLTTMMSIPSQVPMMGGAVLSPYRMVWEGMVFAVSLIVIHVGLKEWRKTLRSQD